MHVPREIERIAYRAAGPEDGPVVLLLHGYPESSYLFRHALDAAARVGWRAVAPDLPGFGDSPPQPPGTWEHHVEILERFRTALGIDSLVLAGHDWGGLIGLRWACEHRPALRGLVLSGTGFFSDARWHGLARALRTEGEGEAIVEGTDRERFARLLEPACPGIEAATVDEFFKCFATPESRRAQLELYRSGDFAKLAAYEGRLAALDVPALALWGETDPFAPVGAGRRFERELPGAQLEVLEGIGHFLWEQDPARANAELARFLRSLG